MFDRTIRLDVRCSQRHAFEHIAIDFFANHPKWDTDIVELTRTSSGPLGVGTTGREIRNVNGRRFVTDFRITEFQPDEAFAHRSTAGAMAEDVDYRIEPRPDGGTRVTLHVSIWPRAFFLKLLAPVIKPQVERNFATNVARFERMLNELALTPA